MARSSGHTRLRPMNRCAVMKRLGIVKILTIAQMARAGFFYRPADDSLDNVQCFQCSVKLDGWEETDNPISEHLGHSEKCAYAVAISVSQHNDPSHGPESRDPLSDLMVAARHGTFTFGGGWPHENKKGWKCKSAKMVDAGWCWDPNPEVDEDNDGATCFYCDLSLDGWEPKDDPLAEHKRRSPGCRFFELLEEFHGSSAGAKAKKGKGRGKTSMRSSTASKASRLSVQSTMSEAPSLAASILDFGADLDDEMLDVDDSVASNSTVASQATTIITKKKAGRPKAAAKGAKGKKTTSTIEPIEVEEAVQYPDLTQARQEAVEKEEVGPAKAKKGGKGSKKNVAVVEASEMMSTIETSQVDAPAKKSSRGRKAQPKVKPEPQTEPEPEPETLPGTPDATLLVAKRTSQVSAQLQDELDDSVHQVEDESTPQVEQPKPKQGVKRTSDGLRKEADRSSVIVTVDIPIPAKQKPATQSKRGRKPKSASIASADVDATADSQIDELSEASEVIKAPQPKPAKKAKGRPKGKKTSSARSSRATVLSEQADEPQTIEDEEKEIEAELERMAAEQAAAQEIIALEQDRQEEFEPSPSRNRISKNSQEIQVLEDEIAAEDAQPPTPPRRSIAATMTPSPSGSDKENQPSSVMPPASSVKTLKPSTAAAALLSPTKTSRVPLAPGTPNRSPTKHRAMAMSPSKQISRLTSTAPWTAVDLDGIFLASPQPTPGRLGQQLTAAAGALTSPEKSMSVEEWVRFRAEQSEAALRKRCEEMVANFEREGVRALQALNGIQVVRS